MDQTFLYATVVEGEIRMNRVAAFMLAPRSIDGHLPIFRGISVPYPGMPDKFKSLGQVLLEAYGYPIPNGSLVITQNPNAGRPQILAVNTVLKTLTWNSPNVQPFFKFDEPAVQVDATSAILPSVHRPTLLPMISDLVAAPFITIGDVLSQTVRLEGGSVKLVDNPSALKVTQLQVQTAVAPSNQIIVSLLSSDDSVQFQYAFNVDDFAEPVDAIIPTTLDAEWASKTAVLDPQSIDVNDYYAINNPIPFPLASTATLRVRVLIVKPFSWNIVKGEHPGELVNIRSSASFYSLFDQDNPILKY